MTFKQFTVSFIVLIGLTVASVIAGGFAQDNNDISQVYTIWLVLAAAMYKGQQITDVFMELNSGPKLWRILMLTYVIVVPFIIGLIYWLPFS